MRRSMEREAAIHMRLRQANIVSMMGVVFDVDNQGFVLEYVKFGSFNYFLEKIKDENGLLMLPFLAIRHSYFVISDVIY